MRYALVMPWSQHTGGIFSVSTEMRIFLNPLLTCSLFCSLRSTTLSDINWFNHIDRYISLAYSFCLVLVIVNAMSQVSESAEGV